MLNTVCNFRPTSNTQAAYSTQIGQLAKIGAEYNISTGAPLSEREISLVVILYAQGHKPTPIPGFVSAIAEYTRSRHNQELPRGRLFNTVMASLRNMYGDTDVSTPKAALITANLLAIRRQLDMRFCEHAREWCACLIAFFGVLRFSEYMAVGLRACHVATDGYSLTITVAYSKTSDAPATIAMSRRSDDLCPLRAYLYYRDFIVALGLPHSPSDTLFLHRHPDNLRLPSRAMTANQFIARDRSYLSSACPQLDESHYAGHSFRRGGSSALILAGVPADSVKAHGRWSSQAYQRYFDAAHSAHLRLAATSALPGAADYVGLVGPSRGHPCRHRRYPTPPASSFSFFFSCRPYLDCLSSVALRLRLNGH